MRFDPIPAIIVLAGSLIIAGFVVFGGNSKNDPASSQSQADIKSGTPQLDIDETDIFLNPQVTIKQKEINIRNSGDGSLILSSLRTTFGGLTVQFKKEGYNSPKFSSTYSSDWQGILDPEEDGIISIVFDNERYSQSDFTNQIIKFQTNDPDNPEVTINIFGT